MGYVTRYEIEATGFKEETEAEFFLFKLTRVVNYEFTGSTTSILLIPEFCPTSSLDIHLGSSFFTRYEMLVTGSFAWI